MSDFFNRIKQGAGGLAAKAMEAGQAVADKVSEATGNSARETIYVEFASAADMEKASSAVAALNGKEPNRVVGIEAAMVVQVGDPEKSDAIMGVINSFKPARLLSE